MEIGNGRRRLLVITDTLIFINYDAVDEVYDAVKDLKIQYVVSSDCHGDVETFMLPLTLPGKKIYLGDYYPYIPQYVKYREQDKSLIEYTKRKYEDMNRLLIANKDEAVFLYGNHDPRIFPVTYETTINDKKFIFQHSLISHRKKPLIKHYYDKMEESWKESTAALFGVEQTDKPEFTLLNDEYEVPDADYIIVGHLPDYSSLGIPNLYTIDASNSSVVEYQREEIKKLRIKHYERRIREIEESLPTAKNKKQLEELLERFKNYRLK